jgi:hypothetical protein
MLSAACSGCVLAQGDASSSSAWVAAVGSSYGDDRAAVSAFFREFKAKTGKAAVVDTYPLLGYSLVQTIARHRDRRLDRRLAATRERSDIQERAPAGEPTTYTQACRVPVKRPLLIRYVNGKPKSTGDVVRPQKVPPYPC